jgi:hypothetical protein
MNIHAMADNMYTLKETIMNEGTIKILVAQINPMNFKCFRIDMMVELDTYI